MHIVDGRLFGCNYGHVFAALPFVWFLVGLARVTDHQIAVGGLWSLVFNEFAVNSGRSWIAAACVAWYSTPRFVKSEGTSDSGFVPSATKRDGRLRLATRMAACARLHITQGSITPTKASVSAR